MHEAEENTKVQIGANAPQIIPLSRYKTENPQINFPVQSLAMLPLTSTMATKMSPLPTNKYIGVLALLSAHSFIGGYYAATQPAGA